MKTTTHQYHSQQKLKSSKYIKTIIIWKLKRIMQQLRGVLKQSTVIKFNIHYYKP
jgi:hypothetical protein